MLKRNKFHERCQRVEQSTTSTSRSSMSIREHTIVKNSWNFVTDSQPNASNSLSQFVTTFYGLLFDHMPSLRPVFIAPGTRSKYLALTVALTVDTKGNTPIDKVQQLRQEYMLFNESLGIYFGTQVVIGRVLLLSLKRILPKNEYCIRVRMIWANRLTKLIFNTLGEGMEKSIAKEDIRTLLQSTEVSDSYFLSFLKQELPMCPGIGGAQVAKSPMFRRHSKQKEHRDSCITSVAKSPIARQNNKQKKYRQPRTTSITITDELVEETTPPTPRVPPKTMITRSTDNSCSMGTLKKVDSTVSTKSFHADIPQIRYESSKMRADGTTEFNSTIPLMEPMKRSECKSPSVLTRARNGMQRAMRRISDHT